MGINFPASPTLDQLHPVPAVPGVPQYKWNGSVWIVQSGGSDTQYVQRTGDTMTGALTLPGNPTTALQTAPKQYVDRYDVRRNRLVNGAMQISQENGNTAGTLHGWHAADMWGTYSIHSAGTITAQRVQVVTSNGSANRIRITITAADATLAAGEYLEWFSGMLADQYADFCWGTASAKQSILRFGFKGPAGTYSIAISNGASRTYIENFTITAGQANTDTTQTFIIPGDTVVATWAGANLNIVLAAGTSFHAVTGWQSATNKMATASNTNGMATAGRVFELFDIGWYLDANNTGVAPVWEMPDPVEELARCQRHYNVFAGLLATTGWTDAAGTSFLDFTYPQMYTAPSVTFSNITYSNASGLVLNVAFSNHSRVNFSNVAAGPAYVELTANLNARIS